MKKDLNQVAKIEQAIEKRWGKEAVENPATPDRDWETNHNLL